MSETRYQHTMKRARVSIELGCETEQEICQSRGRGTLTSGRYKTWQETFTLPEKGFNREDIVCPMCRSPFQLRVYSESKARLRKLYFASCFLAIAACAIVFGIFNEGKMAFMGYSIAAPYVLFSLWQLFGVVRQRFDASDFVSHARGKVHRILGLGKIVGDDSRQKGWGESAHSR